MKRTISNALEAWERGLRLAEAAWEFASDYEKDKYRRAESRRAIETLGLLMQTELISNIYDGRFICFGLNSERGANRGPEKIDRFIFRELGYSEMMSKYIDWNESSLNYAGQQYTAIRVIEASRLENNDTRQAPHKMGRPSIDSLLEAIVRDLQKEGRLSGSLQKGREHIVRVAARAKHPELFPNATQPSKGKILQALKRAGFSASSVPGSKSP